MKSFRSTAVFAAIVLLFAGGVYYFEYVKKNQDQARTEEAKKVFPIEQNDIAEIHLKNEKNGTHLVLKKNQDQWSLTEPVQDLVESSSISSILSTLTFEKGEFVSEGAEADLKEYGLEQPLGHITVKTEKDSRSVTIGTVKSFDGSSYIQESKAAPVKLVASSFADLLTRTADQLRDKRVFPRKLAGVSSIELTKNGKRQFALEKIDGTWRLKDEKYPVDTQAVESYLSTLENLRALIVAAEDSDVKSRRQFLLEKPEGKLVLKTASGQTVLEVSKPGGNIYLASDQRPQIVALGIERQSDIYKDADSFKDKKHPFIFTADKVKNIQLESEKMKLEIVKDGSGEGSAWKLKAPVAGKVLDGVKVEELIRHIGDLEVGEFFGAKSGSGLQPPRNRVVLATGEGQSVLELVWGDKIKQDKAKEDKGSEMVYVKTSKTDETLGVLQSEISSLSYETLLKEPPKDSENEKNDGKNSEKSKR